MHCLVPIAVAALRKRLLAVSAGVRSLAEMRPYVVLDVAQFCELFVAGEALKDLILAPSGLVNRLPLDIAFVFCNLIFLAIGLLWYSILFFRGGELCHGRSRQGDSDDWVDRLVLSGVQIW